MLSGALPVDMVRRGVPGILIAFGVLLPPVRAQDAGTDPDDSARVHAVATGIVAADNARDVEAVLAYYAPDAVLLPPNAPPVVGLDSIRLRYGAMFRAYNPVIEASVTEITVRGDLAYARGHNVGRLLSRGSGGGGGDRKLGDEWLMILRLGRQGRWQITRLMWHPTTP